MFTKFPPPLPFVLISAEEVPVSDVVVVDAQARNKPRQ
jgi:hypothetical protein